MRALTAGAGLSILAFTAAADGTAPSEAEAPVRTASETPTLTPENPSSRIEHIVVTARKRAERIEDVPVSIAVVTVDDIDRRGLVSSEDYLRGMPGVNQGRDHAGQTVVIRGIESSPSYQNWYSGTTVATYFGETPTTNSAGLSGGTNVDLKLVDIQRVEVLRGPQGTAIGSSSLGGAVRTIPIAP
jgi:iron complex outermembrane receptor protein